MSKRSKFKPEFKQGAVEQANQPGVSCGQIARELGIGANLLTRWMREAQAQDAGAFKGTTVSHTEGVDKIAILLRMVLARA